MISFQRHTALIEAALQMIVYDPIIAGPEIDPQGLGLQHAALPKPLGEYYE